MHFLMQIDIIDLNQRQRVTGLVLRKCDHCGKLFNSVGSKLCMECLQLADDAYIKVRKYIYQNHGKADFASIIEETEVSEKTLSYLINEGRIVIENGVGRGTRCRACGAETSSGSLCPQCTQKLISEKLMSGSTEKEKEKEKEKENRKTAGSRVQPLSYIEKN
jgi:hypothetical protein